MELAVPRVETPQPVETPSLVGLAERAVDTTKTMRQGWAGFVAGTRQRYETWKKDLYQRTDNTLEKAADLYVGKIGDWQTERPLATWQAAQRSFDQAKQSVTLAAVIDVAKRSWELAQRGAVVGFELPVQMAAKQMLIDLVVRQGDCDALAQKYEASGGVAAVEKEAVKFADEVKRHFALLQQVAERTMPAAEEDKEVFRQNHINQGVQYAEQLLGKVTLIPPDSKQRILADVRTHLDTVVFDPKRPSLFRAYDKISDQYRHAIQGIMERHIDVYQTSKAKNLSLLTTGARWLTLGVFSFVVGRASAAYTAVSTNYDKALVQLPAHERTSGKRLGAFTSGVRESLTQFIFDDRFRTALRLQGDIPKVIERLITPEQQAASYEEFDVDKIANTVWAEFGTDLTKAGVTEPDLYARIEDLAAFQGDRRKALDHLLRYRLLNLHRETIKATVRQFEHVYRQVNMNATALGVLDQIDQRVESAIETRTAIDGLLGQLEQGAADTTVTVVAAAEPVVAPPLPDAQYAALTSQLDYPVTFPDGAEVPSENLVGSVEYVVEPGDTAWKIATEHLEWYRLREGNPDLTVPQAITLLAEENQLTSASRIGVGQQLHVPSEALPDVPENPLAEAAHGVATESTWAQDLYMTHEMAIEAAKGADHHLPNEHLVTGATRADLRRLPPDEYVVAFGERFGRSGGRMAVSYDATYAVTVTDTGETLARPLGDVEAKPIPLAELLQQEQAPLVRVFTTEPKSLSIDHGQLEPDKWSPYQLAKIEYLKDHPVRVVEKDGAYCAKDLAGRFNLFDEDLAEEIGVNLRDSSGQFTGVTVHAPMAAEAMVTAGGTEVASLQEHFEVSRGHVRPLESLNSDNPTYRYQVEQWLQAAARSPLQSATFFYTGTQIENIIGANKDNGGEPNSHTVTLLGKEDITLPVQRDTTIDRVLASQLGLQRSDLAQRGYLFETLGIEVNGVRITDTEQWLKTPVQTGDTVVVHDIALNHRFHGDEATTLVAMLVDHQTLIPVSVVEPNAEAVNAVMTDARLFGSDFTVNTFVPVQPGSSLEAVLTEGGTSPDLWKAAELTLVERGIDPQHLTPGELIPIFEDEALVAHLDEIYQRAEAREAAASGTEVHIVRPHESMDHITEHFFKRSLYSTAEWANLRDGVARATGIPFGDKTMPGDVYTKPYSVHEYHVQADAVLSIDANTVAMMEQSIWRQRAAEHIYIPTELPIMTEAEGVVMTPFPAEVSRLIDTVVDGHPEYGESVRLALALVYANEGMRETADQTDVSQLLDWVNSNLPDRSATLDQVIATIEYYYTRERAKDFAWSIQDRPWAKASLDFAIAQLRLQPDLPPVLLATLEKAAGVSSAGIFQVRANNFFAEDDSRFRPFEQELRADPLLNTAAAAEILHQNERAFATYVTAFGDPQANDEAARLLALVNSYNGGPYKTMLGSLQERLLYFAQTEQVTIPLDEASGRGTDVTREALLVVCEQLRQEGKLSVSDDQLQRDLAMLGSETVAFLRSDTMQQLKVAYRDSTGQDLSLLPNQQHLNDSNVSYANYGLLATRGGAYDLIQQFSENTRLAKGQALPTTIARDDSPIRSSNKG
ncbi:MAG: LysM peptidoglycan-binding domain-containing protein [Candidatus Kerfeldbacteria bacterium]|nr:LysM peptidoglycan-binding domain-containing protein [Candidatus Kerfeldbacteria bacterium]